MIDRAYNVLIHNQGFPEAFSVGYFLRDKMGHGRSGNIIGYTPPKFYTNNTVKCNLFIENLKISLEELKLINLNAFWRFNEERTIYLQKCLFFGNINSLTLKYIAKTEL